MGIEQVALTNIVAPPPTGGENRPSSVSDIARVLLAKPFRPVSWLVGGHRQTLGTYFWPRRSLKNQAKNDEKRLFEVEPGSRVLAYCRWQTERRAHPTILLVHGLEGSTDSVYMRSMAAKAFDTGFNVVRLNQRTCGGTEHLTPTLYHSGMNRDFLAVINELIDTEGLNRIILSGISMSGNMVLQLAGQHHADLPPELIGICAVSPSVDLMVCAADAGRPENRFYRRQFIASIGQRMKRKAQLFPDRYDLAAMSGIEFIADFDQRYTVPHGGFRDVEDYYTSCSSRPYIGNIRIPTLIIHAKDDPVVPYSPLLDPVFHENPNVLLISSETGGHVGFLGKASETEDRFWAENRVIEFGRLVAEKRK